MKPATDHRRAGPASRTPELIPTRQTLLHKLRDLDDHESWQEFFDSYSDLIYAVAIKAGLAPHEAEEVLQETVTAVARKMPDFRYDQKGSFKAWLLNLTRWRIADRFRKLQRQQPVAMPAEPEAESSPSPWPSRLTANQFETLWDEEWQKHLITSAFEAVRKQVSTRQFQIYDLLVNEGWTVNQTKSALGVSSTQVYLARHRVGGLMKKAIKRIEKGAM